MANILYLHGFMSCGESNKTQLLKQHFNSVDSPNLPYSPTEAIAFIEKQVKQKSYSVIIGSSLGGFYATYIAQKYGMKAVLLNPSTKPWETLKPYVGWQERFCDNEAFEFKAIYLEQLKALSVTPTKGQYVVLLQSGDEVLDYKEALTLYKNHRVIVEYGGNHRFENLHEYISFIAP